MDIDRIIEMVRTLKEESAPAVPTNNASSGAIAGLPPDEPPVGKRKRKKKGEPTILARGKFPGARARWKKGIVLFFTGYRYPLVLFLFFWESPQIGQRKVYRSDLTLLNFCKRDETSPIYLESTKSIIKGHYFDFSIVVGAALEVKKMGAILLPAPMMSAATTNTPPTCQRNFDNPFISTCILSILS